MKYNIFFKDHSQLNITGTIDYTTNGIFICKEHDEIKYIIPTKNVKYIQSVNSTEDTTDE